jgi:transposase InsO family protein
LVPSVGSVGDSYDNALAETINGLYKAEVIWRQRSWPNASAVEMAPLRWVEWLFNRFTQVKAVPQRTARRAARICGTGWRPEISSIVHISVRG